MKRPANFKNHHSFERGFSLIVTITMMILMALISIGLLSLSTVTLRSSTHAAAPLEAQANARLALMLAIGELQKLAGPDTRVTARADILDRDNPPVLGVWRSWEGDDHERSGPAAGRPIAPSYENEKEERFLSWLISEQGTQVPDVSKGGGKVTLLGANSVGEGGDRERLQIHIEPTEVFDGQKSKGSFAWWVSGENQKARLSEPDELTSGSNGQWAAQMKSHAVSDPDVFGIQEDAFDDATLLEKVVGMRQTDFISQQSSLRVSQEFYHDLSVNSVGLLTNVATGGWKKDLSLFSEDSRRETRNLPLFRLAPGEEIEAEMATTRIPRAEKSILYPWSAYRGTNADIPIYQHGAVSSWANLLDYVTAYQRVRASSSGRATITPRSERIDGDKYRFLHQVRLLPVIARVQWVFSHSAAPSTDRSANPGDLEARLLMTPVVTMWNPYSVQLDFTDVPISFLIPKPLPVALRYKVNGIQGRSFNCLFGDSRDIVSNSPALSDAKRLEYIVSRRFTLMPGETQVFSPRSARPVAASSATMELSPGYRSQGGHYFTVNDSSGRPFTGSGATLMQAEARFDTVYKDLETGVGIYLDMKLQGTRHLVYRMVYTPEVARSVYSEISDMGASTLDEALSSPQPFLTTVFGFRMASKTHLAAKGFLQSSPLVNYTAMGGKDVAERTIARHYGGTSHPVNSPFDYSFSAVSPNDSLLPNQSTDTNRGYIVTGFGKSDGLSRCVIAEIPTRPLQSLAELQHWDLRYENPIPPFAFNLIGNSDASPLLPSDAVVNSADAGLAVNLQHDDSFCANHLLFDDWFFSSIAAAPSDFGSNGRSQEDTFFDLMKGEAPLPNQAYEATFEDLSAVSQDSSKANALYQEHVSEKDSWQSVASRLQVKGMFNVNSTSVNAWRALLRHAKDQEIPHITESGGGWDVERSSPTDYAFSRFTIAGDVEASQRGSAGAFPGAAQFSGYREFDEQTLDLLAEEVVEQVRLRGPFLSLAEFVNRQLSSGELALAGAIQTALNEVAKGSSNPFAALEGEGTEPSLAEPPGGANAEYQFPQAAVGRNTYGLPGWTRQADILRPLAPILTARDDTFTIRAYGDSRDSSGRILSTAVCEAVVQRTRDYVDPFDLAETTTLPEKEVNRNFGRRLKIVSFRWLSPSEV